MSGRKTRALGRLVPLWPITLVLAFVSSCTPQIKQAADGKISPEQQTKVTMNKAAADSARKNTRPLRVVKWTGESYPEWKQVQKLQDEQKFRKALELVEKILERARKEGNSEEELKALVRIVQLKSGLHEYETAVRWFREQPWPEDLLGRTACELYYTRLLLNYASNYSWEIRSREKVASKGPVDLKAWTLEQIYAEARKALHRIWLHRQQLGELDQSALGKYVEKNNYPRGIRGTLRDLVTYQLVYVLSDRQGWRPEHTNEIYALNLKDLVGPARPMPADHDLADGEVHPLRHVAAVLKDLESWHARKGEREAALEARLELLRRLYASFTQQDDRKFLKRQLEQRLEKERDIAWWAAGMALLVEWRMQDGDPWALKEARRMAIDCHERYPDSIGGKRCLSQKESIEMPDYRLEAMAADAPGKRSILVVHKNLEKLYFRAWRMDLLKMISESKDYDIFPRGRKLERILEGKPTLSWEVELPSTPDYRMHRTFVTPPMKKPGYYLVVASARKDFGRSDNKLMAINTIVTDLVMVKRQQSNWVQVTVLSGKDGQPVAGARVDLYRYDWQNWHRKVATKTTGTDGTVTLYAKGRNNFFVLARKGGQLVMDPEYMYLYSYAPRDKTTATLLYTDRSVYRPGQKIHFKAVVYSGRRSKADYHTIAGRRVRVYLRDANGKTVADATYRTNEHGTASGSFTIPTGRLLGQWYLEASPVGSAAIRVEEYKRPTFEVEIEAPKEQLRLNRPARLHGKARYYFGLPVTSGKVLWRVHRTPRYPWWWGWWNPYPAESEQIVASGVAKPGDDGRFEISFMPRADERLAKSGISYNYRITAEVTDEGGETRSATKNFRLGFVAVEATIEMEEQFTLAGKEREIEIVRTTLNGTGAAGKGKWRLLALEQPSKTPVPSEIPAQVQAVIQDEEAFRTTGDMQRSRWNHGYDPRAVMYRWKDGKEITGGDLVHDDKGRAKVKLPALRPGAYRLRYTTRDAFGKEFTTQHEFIVAAKKMNLRLPAVVMLERSTVPVGQTARLLAHSGLEGQRLFVELWRDGKLFKRRILGAGRDSSLIEIPVTERERGGFTVIAFAVMDHQFVQFQQNVTVPWDNHELKVEFATFRDKLRPGQKETWTVKVTGPAGKDSAVAGAEVLAYMYDRSLDIFAPHAPPSVLSVFPSYARWLSVLSSSRAARQSWPRSRGFTPPLSPPTLYPSSLPLFDGYGIGGLGIRGAGHGGGGRAFTGARRRRARRGGVMFMAKSAPAPARAKAAGETRTLAFDERQVPEEPEAKKGPAPGEAQTAAPVELRTDFSETAFFQPHLVTNEDGSVEIRFEVPDSVTAWNVWVHAVTRDMSGGSLKKEARTIKELMVRPYLPRFLREGDRARLRVVVNNSSERKLEGELEFDIIDPESEKSLLGEFGLSKDAARRAFSAEPGRGATIEFEVRAPMRVGLVAVKAVARSGNLSDGELRPVPLLPGRFHLMQSRFVTVKGGEKRSLRFADMEKTDDPTRIDEKLVVTIDAQLFYSVLAALPYLLNYPYECTEQLLNRFLAAGIVSSLFEKYPAVAKMAKKLSSRKTLFERFDRPDPNRKMALEETPWLVESEGGGVPEKDLVKLLVPSVAKAHRDSTLEKLRKAQTSSGAFPWFPGGPPSPYITLYLLYGFSKGLEFGVQVPMDMVQRAWQYMKDYYVSELVEHCMAEDACWETITFLNYILSNYPDTRWTAGVFTDEDRKKMLDFSFRHWKQHAPMLKAYLALTLHRMKREKDARLVWESVMDSAKTDRDLGTYWAPEDRSWLWYNDTIEAHAMAVRTELELAPKDPKLDGLVQWLFLNKKLNHWKSTKATAEVIYSLAHYLKEQGTLGAREKARVRLGEMEKLFVFEPDEYTGKSNHVVVPGSEMQPRKHSTVEVENLGRNIMFASATWHFSTERPPAEARGDLLKVKRRFYKRIKQGREVVLRPLREGEPIAVGDEIEVHISLRAGHPVGYVHLRDPRPAGCEPVALRSGHKWSLGIYWYEEVRDSGMNFFFERLPQGEYPFKHRMRAAVAGTFKVAPATVQPMYAPEFAAYSSGYTMTIRPE